MKQIYHSNATTNVRLRTEINKSTLSNQKLRLKYGVSENTIGKWKNRTNFTDKSSKPKTIYYSLSELETIIAVDLQTITWWALDELRSTSRIPIKKYYHHKSKKFLN
ncbi:MAG: hypothetical protein L3J08_06150 [Flavobacteriaceae bacterium]|nr:hypothetical protein [Flavobacteriaceae bacterium]